MLRPERFVRRGELIQVRPAVYAAADRWAALTPWDRYLARVHAVALTHPAAVFSHESAAALWGLPIFGEPPIVHVLHGVTGTSRLSAGVRTHTTAGHRELIDLDGLLLTSAQESVVDIARTRHAALALAVADAALRADPSLRVEQLVALNESRPTSRGRRLARWALHRATPLAETALESLSRAVIEWLGFEDPELQVEFARPEGVDRVDFFWRDRDVGGEADGAHKYDGSFGDPVALLLSEKERDARLRGGMAGLVRWGWDDATHPDRLRAILVGGGLSPLRQPNTSQLASVRRIFHGAAR